MTKVFKISNCDTCGAAFTPTGPRNRWCGIGCRLLDSCDRSGGDQSCWRWTASIDKRGYGEINIRRTIRFAHRVSFETFNSTIPAGMVVMHSCDNPACINPLHLVAGTQADNVADMITKGRQQTYRDVPRGESHGCAKITAEIASAIAKSTDKLDEIAANFGVTRWIVERIRYGKTWSHVTGIKPNRRTASLPL